MKTIKIINIIVSLLIILLFNSCKEVKIRGIVISHATTADRNGMIEYYTIAKFDDGYIRSITGLDSYIVPIDGIVYKTYYDFK